MSADSEFVDDSLVETSDSELLVDAGNFVSLRPQEGVSGLEFDVVAGDFATTIVGGLAPADDDGFFGDVFGENICWWIRSLEIS